MTEKEHKIQVEKLNQIEDQLINLIFEVGNEQLQEKFNEWQDQRLVCNEGFMSYLGEILKPKDKTEA